MGKRSSNSGGSMSRTLGKNPQPSGGATQKGGVGSNRSSGAGSHSAAGQKSGRPTSNNRQPKEVNKSANQ